MTDTKHEEAKATFGAHERLIRDQTVRNYAEASEMAAEAVVNVVEAELRFAAFEIVLRDILAPRMTCCDKN